MGEAEIRVTFIEHACASGLILDYAIADGRWHRCRTQDKPRQRNGAYVRDGRRGAVRNWATMDCYVTYRDHLAERLSVERYREVGRQAREKRFDHQRAAANLAEDM